MELEGNANEARISLGNRSWRAGRLAPEALMSLKCILIGGALVWGGYYLYRHKKFPFRR